MGYVNVHMPSNLQCMCVMLTRLYIFICLCVFTCPLWLQYQMCDECLRYLLTYIVCIAPFPVGLCIPSLSSREHTTLGATQNMLHMTTGLEGIKHTI